LKGDIRLRRLKPMRSARSHDVRNLPLGDHVEPDEASNFPEGRNHDGSRRRFPDPEAAGSFAREGRIRSGPRDVPGAPKAHEPRHHREFLRANEGCQGLGSVLASPRSAAKGQRGYTCDLVGSKSGVQRSERFHLLIIPALRNLLEDASVLTYRRRNADGEEISSDLGGDGRSSSRSPWRGRGYGGVWPVRRSPLTSSPLS